MLSKEKMKEIEEEEAYRLKLKKDGNKKSSSLFKKIIISFVILSLLGMLPALFVDTNKNSNIQVKPTETPEQKKEWEESKAGKICKEHLTWTKEDCIYIANNKIWIGMSYEMLVYQYGKPSSTNPSNYGNGTRWQWCWHNYASPNCFYDNNDDGIIDSYN